MSESQERKRLFVLDTNVLMHDPSALFRFKEHDLFIPMVVLEELDRGKKGTSEVARNARQASRFLDEMMCNAGKELIDAGLPIPNALNGSNGASPSGRLFFQARHLPHMLPDTLPGNTPDNNILDTALALKHERADQDVVLISKDINLRIKAAVVGLNAEDYNSDQVLEDVNLLYTGEQELPAGFWERHGKQIDSWQEEGRTFYRVSGEETANW